MWETVWLATLFLLLPSSDKGLIFKRDHLHMLIIFMTPLLDATFHLSAVFYFNGPQKLNVLQIKMNIFSIGVQHAYLLP